MIKVIHGTLCLMFLIGIFFPFLNDYFWFLSCGEVILQIHCLCFDGVIFFFFGCCFWLCGGGLVLWSFCCCCFDFAVGVAVVFNFIFFLLLILLRH